MLHDYGFVLDYNGLVLDWLILSQNGRSRLKERSFIDSRLFNWVIAFIYRDVRFVVYHLCQFVGLLVLITLSNKVFDCSVLFSGRLLG